MRENSSDIILHINPNFRDNLSRPTDYLSLYFSKLTDVMRSYSRDKRVRDRKSRYISY